MNHKGRSYVHNWTGYVNHKKRSYVNHKGMIYIYIYNKGELCESLNEPLCETQGNIYLAPSINKSVSE